MLKTISVSIQNAFQNKPPNISISQKEIPYRNSSYLQRIYCRMCEQVPQDRSNFSCNKSLGMARESSANIFNYLCCQMVHYPVFLQEGKERKGTLIRKCF